MTCQILLLNRSVVFCRRRKELPQMVAYFRNRQSSTNSRWDCWIDKSLACQSVHSSSWLVGAPVQHTSRQFYLLASTSVAVEGGGDFNGVVGHYSSLTNQRRRDRRAHIIVSCD